MKLGIIVGGGPAPGINGVIGAAAIEAINRGVEVTPEVADGPHSIILHQVTNGLAVRMAVLWLVCGAAERERG